MAIRISGYRKSRISVYRKSRISGQICRKNIYNILQSFDFMWPQPTLCDLLWFLVTSYDLSRPHGTSADQTHVSLAFLMGPQQPFCDHSRPLVIFNDRIRPNLNSNDPGWPHRTSCDLRRPHMTLDILMGPRQSFCGFSRPIVTLADLEWPQ